MSKAKEFIKMANTLKDMATIKDSKKSKKLPKEITDKDIKEARKIDLPLNYLLNRVKERQAKWKFKMHEPRPVSLISKQFHERNKLFVVKGLSKGSKSSSGRRQVYNVTIVFHEVESQKVGEDKRRKLHKVTTPAGGFKFIRNLSKAHNPIAVRCSCPDFMYTAGYYNKKEHALAGPAFPPYKRKTPKYPKGRPARQALEANPKVEAKEPILCKHLVGMVAQLEKIGILKR